MIRRRRSGNARGQAILEFALVAPIFILALLALIEFGRAVYYVQMLHSAAREGARYGIVHGSASGCPSGPMPAGQTNFCDPNAEFLKQAVRDYAVAIINSSPSDFVITPCWTKEHDLTPNSCAANNAGGDFGADGADNLRGSTVRVTVSYSYSSFLSPYVPLPPFVLTGESTLVINN